MSVLRLGSLINKRFFHFAPSALEGSAFKFTYNKYSDSKLGPQVSYTVKNVPDISESSALSISIANLRRRESPRVPTFERRRIVPELETFYAANPIHERNINQLNELLNKYINLPTLKNVASNAKDYRWINLSEYKLIGGGTRLKPIQYKELVQILNRLDTIDKQLVNQEIIDTMEKYKKPLNNFIMDSSLNKIDNLGRAIAIGRRKTSSAKVYLVKGEGKILINGENVEKYLPRLSDRTKILYPLKVVDCADKFNIFVKVSGGGLTGQTGAIKMGIARALVIYNPLFKNRLRRSDSLTRDSRSVERKKPGKVKARKAPTWVKR